MTGAGSFLPLADAEQIVYNLSASVVGRQEWCDRRDLDCTGEGACWDCGNDLDTLCPLIALPAMLAVVGVTQKDRPGAPS